MGLLPPIRDRLPKLVLPAALTSLPGWRQRQRALRVWAAAGLLMVLRPYLPLRLLPGWLVGGLLVWALVELLLWLWWPRRSA
jgi:hypothetical protein